MSYYHIVQGLTYTNAKEREDIHEMLHRPISFLEKLRVGKREHGFFGTKEVEVEVDSHDKVRVTALIDTTLVLKIHEKIPDQADIIDLKQPLVPRNSRLDESQKYEVIRLARGSQLDLYRTSFVVGDKIDEQIRWSLSDGHLQGELFSEFCIKTLNEAGFLE
ncbi:MAG: hypothetical protein WBD86_02160 [Microgenomates group bacterium]